MIPALEHEFTLVAGEKGLRVALAQRSGIDGWTLVTATNDRGLYTLFWSRQAPASPNTGETT